MKKERQEGYYWVQKRFELPWQIAWFDSENNYWLTIGGHEVFADVSWDKINEKRITFKNHRKS